MRAHLQALKLSGIVMSFTTISVIGLGYIGLPTAAAFASRQKQVIGVNYQLNMRWSTINRGEIHIVGRRWAMW